MLFISEDDEGKYKGPFPSASSNANDADEGSADSAVAEVGENKGCSDDATWSEVNEGAAGTAVNEPLGRGEETGEKSTFSSIPLGSC